jgi:hypothetical protein
MLKIVFLDASQQAKKDSNSALVKDQSQKSPKTNHPNAAKTKKKKSKGEKKKKTVGKKKAAGNVNKQKTMKKAAAIGKKSSNRQSGSCPGNSDCLDLAVLYMNIARNKVATYQKQTNRFSKLSSASNTKGGKKNAFDNSLNQLITAGGGNVSNMACGSNTSNAGEMTVSEVFKEKKYVIMIT